MPLENLNERVAVLEFRVSNSERIIEDFLEFKEDMIRQLADLRNSISLLTWKVGLIVGVTVLAGTELLRWAIKTILPHS